MHNKSIVELGAALRAGECSSVELARHFLQRIEALDGELNSLISTTAEQALAAAEAADKQIAAGEAGSLTGIPIIHKDIFCTEGVKTSCGSRMLDSFISPYDATVVRITSYNVCYTKLLRPRDAALGAAGGYYLIACQLLLSLILRPAGRQ